MPLPAVARFPREPAPDPAQEARSARRSRSQRNVSNDQSASSAQSERPPNTYGYHNTFHTHQQPATTSPPPTYACAIGSQATARLHAIQRAIADAPSDTLPLYTCSVEIEGTLGLKYELSTPFQVASNRHWNDVYVVLHGTQLNIHRIKNPSFLSKHRKPGPGRLLKSYTLQHAEIGLAADFKKTDLIPKSPFAHLVPVAARQKVFETDPHLFEPVREFALRLRVETEQILLCCPSQRALLDWVESLCAAVDIASPIDDRSEPRYRSLPRRSRRQRAIDGSRLPGDLDNIGNIAAGRRLLEEQARIIATLYPNLATSTPTTETATPEQPIEAPVTHESHESEQAHVNSDPEADDLDPADFQYSGSRRSQSADAARVNSENHAADTTAESTELTEQVTRTSSNWNPATTDPKTPPRQASSSQSIRYRRRCAPILLASSPRASDVVFSAGKRMRINVKDFTLVDYLPHPPRYDAHAFPRTPKLASTPEEPATAPAATTTPQSQRPNALQRGPSNDSVAYSFASLDADAAAFGYDLASTSSAESPEHARPDGDDIASEPPSPTTANPPRTSKMDAARGMLRLGKVRTSDEAREDMGGLSAAFSVGMLI